MLMKYFRRIKNKLFKKKQKKTDDKTIVSLGNDKQIIGGKKGCVMINGRSRMVLNHRLLNLPFNTILDVTKQLEISGKSY